MVVDFPFQIYSSLLILTPLDPALKEAFHHDNPSWIVSNRSGSSTQTPCRAILEDDGAARILVTSCTGPLLASSTLRGRINIWNIAAEKLITAFEVIIPPQGEICFLSFSPDNKFLAITIDSALGYVTEVWVISGKGRTNLHGHRLDGGLSVFSPTGQLIMCPIRSHAQDHILRIIDIHSTDSDMALQHPPSVSNLYPRALSRSGQWVLFTSLEKQYCLFDTTSQSLHPIDKQNMPHGQPVAVSPDGRFITIVVFKSTDGYRYSASILIWDIAQSEVCLQLEGGHGGSLAPNFFSVDSRWFSVIGADLHSIGIFKTATKTLDLTIVDQTNCMTSIAMSPAGDIVACATAGGIVRLYDVQVGLSRQHNEDREEPVWRSESPFALSSPYDSQYTKAIDNMYLSMDGTLLASTGHNGTLRTWEMKKGQCVSAKLDHFSHISALTMSQQKTFIATGSYMGVIMIWQSHWSLHSNIEGHDNHITALEFSPNEEEIVSGALDGTIKVWCIATGLVSRIINCSSAIKYLALSSNHHLAIATELLIEVRDISLDANPLLLAYPISERLYVYGLKLIFSPNGRYLVARSPGPWARLWYVSKTSAKAEGERTSSMCQSRYEYSRVASLDGETLKHSWYATDAVGISPYDIDHTGPWVRYRGHRVLWLPPEYRSAYYYVANEDSIALGNISGNISFIRFSPELPRLVDKWYGEPKTPQYTELQTKFNELGIEGMNSWHLLRSPEDEIGVSVSGTRECGHCL